MVDVSNIDVTRGKTHILRKVNVRLQAGEIVAVIGANGAGKSTLLKAIAGALPITGGGITINNCPLASWAPEALARIRGILSQQTQLTFAMQVIDVVLLGRFPHSKQESTQASMAIARHCLQQVGMEKFAYRNILTLSGGEQQRVHFARVLAQIYQEKHTSIKYLLLDEPTASLDISQQHHILSKIRVLSEKQKVGVLIILHDINLAANYADRVILMKHGAVIAAGNPDEVFTSQNILYGFNVHADIIKNSIDGQTYISTFRKSTPFSVEH
ncbi:MAG: hemin import ATP-binding protein HmuV [Saprospiraceae bacterium]|nr:MAG: hemin import ATP-binding protein HmuV [Saprospiraceae bacterium]